MRIKKQTYHRPVLNIIFVDNASNYSDLGSLTIVLIASKLIKHEFVADLIWGFGLVTPV